MQTSLFKVYFHNGSIYNVFCKGRAQIKRFNHYVIKHKDEIERFESIVDGIHEISEFEKRITNKLP
jgi:hypothetical protein